MNQQKLPPIPPSKIDRSAETGVKEISKDNKEKHEESKHNRLYANTDRIDTWLNTAASNGLFNQEKVKAAKVTFRDVQDELIVARKNLDAHDYSECESNISFAIDKYSDALYSASITWRFVNVYAGDLLIYLVLFLIGIFVFYYMGGYSSILSSLLENTVGKEFYQTAVHAVVWGTIGSILRSFWFLKFKINDRRYSNSWRFHFIVAPFIGAILGAIIYFLVIGGFYALSGEKFAGTVDPILIIPLALLAGFNWEWAIEVFKKISELFSTPSGAK